MATRTIGPAVTAFLAAVAAATIAVPAASALPECENTAPGTRQCERGTHTQINSSPTVIVNTGPYLERPWLYPGIPVYGIGGWAAP